MRRQQAAGGFTLIEALIAMAVLLIGAVGLTGIFRMGLRMNGDARRMLRATAVAQDLLENIQTWPYKDNVSGTPLANKSTSNDGDIADTGLKFEYSVSPVADGLADHDESDLTALGVGWTGIPAGELGEFQRYWNVAYIDPNGNGVRDAVQIAVIVRWPHGDGWRRVVLISGKLNPGGS